MTDLGGFDARATVISSAQEQARVFAKHRARISAMQGVTNPRLLLQDTDRRLFGWFLSRVDARWALRRALGLTKV